MKESEKKKGIFGLVRKEFLYNIRSNWVIAIGLLFVGLNLLISVLGGFNIGLGYETESLETFVQEAQGILSVFIPIAALVMSHKTIAEEVESKSISLLLTSGLKRIDVSIGKFLGQVAVLSTIILGGLVGSGIILGSAVGFGDIGLYTGFILMSLAFGGAWIALGMLMSSIVSTSSRALAGGVFLWFFFNAIFQLVLSGALYIAEGGITAEAAPGWYYAGTLFNPSRVYGNLVGTLTFMENLPSWMNAPLLSISLLIWILVPLGIGMWYLDRRDL